MSDRKCVITNADTGCKTEFVYGFNSYGVGEVRYSTLSECPPKIEVSHIAFGLMAALVAVGLGLLLLWRLLLFLYDRQEYARFLKESENAKWSTVRNVVIKVCMNIRLRMCMSLTGQQSIVCGSQYYICKPSFQRREELGKIGSLPFRDLNIFSQTSKEKTKKCDLGLDRLRW